MSVNLHDKPRGLALAPLAFPPLLPTGQLPVLHRVALQLPPVSLAAANLLGSRVRLRGMLRVPPPRGSPRAFPRARAAPASAGPGGGSGGGPRSATQGSCLRSPRRLRLLPLGPAPPPRAGICELPGPGASPLALRSQPVSASPCAARVPRRPGIPRAPRRRRAPRAREPGALGAWDPAEPLASPRGSAGMQTAL